MQWPRGKYNGQRICGFTIKFGVNVFWWGLRAEFLLGQPFVQLGPFNVRAEVIYHIHDRVRTTPRHR